eukprot:TRINITY_DN9625_c0_g1_i1.p2 TRINITY_DN9625_c0_g1~~TRINITY_DN9625_c0_g1_i1.p2  ORF type:complete len:164 (+),score=27.71 TRINITY_DN9625_c0_g1_i1:55-546(+)
MDNATPSASPNSSTSSSTRPTDSTSTSTSSTAPSSSSNVNKMSEKKMEIDTESHELYPEVAQFLEKLHDEGIDFNVVEEANVGEYCAEFGMKVGIVGIGRIQTYLRNKTSQGKQLFDLLLTYCFISLLSPVLAISGTLYLISTFETCLLSILFFDILVYSTGK